MTDEFKFDQAPEDVHDNYGGNLAVDMGDNGYVPIQQPGQASSIPN